MLHQCVVENLRSLSDSAGEKMLGKVVHATFIKPYGHLFWRDYAGWAVYWPNITGDDVREWDSPSPV
jgi:hypothetical protein